METHLTADGSVTCRDPETGELYHNRAGAYTEALCHYTQAGDCLRLLEEKRRLTVLDTCYGLGYNTWVLLAEAARAGLRDVALDVLAVERDPKVIALLPRILQDPRFDPLNLKTPSHEHNIYYRTLGCLSDTKGEGVAPAPIIIHVADKIALNLSFYIEDLRTALPKLAGPVDLVFHDPFSPARVPELWTADLFREYFRLLQPSGGRLLTYSAAAAVRGGLREAGFHLYRTGPLGDKQGGTLASVVPIPEGTPLLAAELAYLESRAGVPYRDPGLQGNRESILALRRQEQAASGRPSGSGVRKDLLGGCPD